MATFYTDEVNAQIIIALLKAHNIRKIIVSPGATNLPVYGSVQYDPFFEVYSSVDERSAAYLACGLAEQSGEKVAISCTGSTASRNYLPGLTEAYYRKLPIIAITSMNGSRNNGNLLPQNIDRSSPPNDVCKISVDVPIVKDDEDFRYVNRIVNQAILESERHGGGPVHINLNTSFMGTFDTKVLPQVRVVKRFALCDELPALEASKIAVFCGAHRFTATETASLSRFCQSTGAVVLCGHDSGYYGSYRVDASLVGLNLKSNSEAAAALSPDLVIHIGEISASYEVSGIASSAKQVWRVSEDGELRDLFHKLRYIFEMPAMTFFELYSDVEGEDATTKTEKGKTDYYEKFISYDRALRDSIPELPFSNFWVAGQTAHRIPENSKITLAILNSVRSWNLFPLKTEERSVNTGGFGIDGILSTSIGSSLAAPEKLHFCILGDLAFFYDMNVLGNRHVRNNVRIMLVNNKRGVEFRLYHHPAYVLGEKGNEFAAAAHHYENHFEASTNVESSAKAWAQSLGYLYLSATNKQEYLENLDRFLVDQSERPILFEVFTEPEDEADALKLLSSLVRPSIFDKMKNTARRILPKSVKRFIKKQLGGR